MNGKVWISTGASRLEKAWKNQQVSWEKLAKKLETPVRTKETYAEYMAMKKDEQDKIKDVGGFVGGTITGGRRVKNSCTARSVITLDVDFADEGFWIDFLMQYECEAVLYSTHKHGLGRCRYRLLIPCSRDVMPDEYEAVARKVAGDLGIELFDSTTFQPERLMYWPSCSKDGLYVYERSMRNEWLDVDHVLETYADWRDVTQWPVSEKAKKRVLDTVSKQEDPAEKGGVVGVFCRVHSVSSAIDKYLSHVYEQTDTADRYTYREGSTFGGLAVYDDKWAYSHHSTDPVSGRMCNAFDLVRIHLFGDSDDRVEEGTPNVKKPSYDKMIELATKDDKVKVNIVQDKVEKRVAKVERQEGRSEEDWQQGLEVDKKGNTLNTISNVVLILSNDERLKGVLGYDDLRKVPIVLRDLPWRKVGKFSREMVDTDDAEIRQFLEMYYGVTSKDKIKDALDIVVKQNLFHPVKEYLGGCKWDGVERLDTMLIKWLGAEDNAYVREVTRKTFVAAVARVYEPGIKFDHVLVLTGPQGIGKSRLIARLGGEWYSDTFGNLQNKDAMEQIQGVWIMELGELAGLRRQEVDTIKLFISKEVDRFRVAYGRRVDTFPRQCIFIGTTNNEEFLQDVTGNRRFWPVSVLGVGSEKEGVKDMKQSEIDQIWAEACVRYVMGEDLYLTGEIVGMAVKEQEKHSETHDLTNKLADYLDTKVPSQWINMTIYDRRDFLTSTDELKAEGLYMRDYITIPEIWTELVGGSLKDMTRPNTKYLRDIMNKMPGWKSYLINRKPYGTQRGWVREDSSFLVEIKNAAS